MQSSIQGEINNLQTQIDSLNAQILNLQKGSLSTSPELTAAETELTNLYGQKTTLQVELSSYADVQQKATPLGIPVRSTQKQSRGPRLLIGLLAGCGIAFVREQLDVSLRSTSGVKELTDAPVLAELPFDREFSLDNGTYGLSRPTRIGAGRIGT